MLEVILVLMIISTALISVITGVARTVNYVSEMKQRTLALNLAKEGIETVYNIGEDGLQPKINADLRLPHLMDEMKVVKTIYGLPLVLIGLLKSS